MPPEEHSPHDGCLHKLCGRIRKLPVLLIPGLLQAIAGLATFEYSYMIVKHTDFFNLSICSIFFMILSGTSGVLAACCTQRRLGGALGRLSLQEYQRKSSNNLLHYRSLLLVGTALSFAFFVQGCYFLIDSQIHQEQADNVEPLSEIIYHESHPRDYWIYNPWSGYDDVFFPIDVKYHYISMVVVGAVFVQVLLFSAIFIHRIAKRRLAELDARTSVDQFGSGRFG
ncbi:hypothetical protein BV898_13764 [Hypsibius exemplaris]|uniref:Uncharacterized protein n=1 Tax=Hypsibius exemplaris TaxID=2072580 RepID=A0A1W0W9W6_HYPEX|nr:hypothetical protein BV898_13764 [Hypsibius exemplaris]